MYRVMVLQILSFFDRCIRIWRFKFILAVFILSVCVNCCVCVRANVCMRERMWTVLKKNERIETYTSKKQQWIHIHSLTLVCTIIYNVAFVCNYKRDSRREHISESYDIPLLNLLFLYSFTNLHVYFCFVGTTAMSNDF